MAHLDWRPGAVASHVVAASADGGGVGVVVAVAAGVLH